jgi:ribose transport system substrate-binding protein
MISTQFVEQTSAKKLRRRGFGARLGAVGLTLALIASACGDDEDSDWFASQTQGEKITIGYTPPTLTLADFYINMARGFMTEAEALGMNVEMLVKSPTTHAAAEEQLGIVESYINQGVDYLWISPVAFEAGEPMMAAANEAGIPVLTGPFMDKYTGVDILAYVGFSEFDAGAMQAQFAIDEFGDQLKVAICQGAPGAFSDHRVNGIKSVLEQHSGVELVAEPIANWSRQECLEAVETIVQAHPDLNVVFPVAGDMGLGAVEGLKTSGALHNPTEVVGFDSLGQEANSIARGEEYASIFNNPMGIGALVAQTVKTHMEGGTPQSDRLVSLIPITRDNVMSELPGWFRGETEPEHFPEY